MFLNCPVLTISTYLVNTHVHYWWNLVWHFDQSTSNWIQALDYWIELPMLYRMLIIHCQLNTVNSLLSYSPNVNLLIPSQIVTYLWHDIVHWMAICMQFFPYVCVAMQRKAWARERKHTNKLVKHTDEWMKENGRAFSGNNELNSNNNKQINVKNTQS